MGMEYGLVSFLRDGESVKVIGVREKQKFGKILVEETEETREEIGELSADKKTVYVKYVVECTGTRDLGPSERNFPTEQVSIFYSVDGIDYHPAMEMVSVPGRWVGVKNGIFCLTSKEESKGYVTVESVAYHKLYHNPVKRGFFPDPSVVRVGNDYYMVNSTFQYFPAIAISHSTDMIHWEVIGHAITDSEDLNLSDIKDSHGIWAPDIAYDNGKFVIMATLRLNGDGKRENNVLRRQLVVNSDKPDDPKRHTGTLVGIYANNGGCGSRIAADFDYFEYMD